MKKNIPVTFGPSTDVATSPFLKNSRVINAFTELSDNPDIPFAIYSGPGTKDFATFTSGGEFRGFILRDPATAYAVSGENLYKLRANGVATQIGVVQGSGPVIMAANKKNTGPQIAIVTGTIVYLLENDVLITYPDADLPLGANSVAYIDGYLVFSFNDGRFYITAINEAGSVNALDFAEAEGSPDNCVCLFVDSRQILIFGDESIEPWVNTGNAAFPFERINGAFMPIGLLSKHTPKSVDNSVMFVSSKGHVARIEGYVAKRVSNAGVEKSIQDSVNKGQQSEIVAWTYVEGGHEYYCLAGRDWSYQFDASTNLWLETESIGFDRTRRQLYLRAFNKHLVGDLSLAKCYEVNFDTRTEAGGSFVWSVRSSAIEFGSRRIRFDALSVIMDVGQGIAGAGGETETPKIMLRWSDDRGKTWDGDLVEEFGQQGEYGKQILFTRLGTSQGHGRIFEISSSSPVFGALIKAEAAIQVLAV